MIQILISAFMGTLFGWIMCGLVNSGKNRCICEECKMKREGDVYSDKVRSNWGRMHNETN